MLGRLDYQFSPPKPAVGTRRRVSPQYAGTFTPVLGNRAVNEIRAGATAYERQDQPDVRWQGGDFPYHPVLHGNSPVIQLPGFVIGANSRGCCSWGSDSRSE
jgi:hypothetical protein